MSDYFTVVAEVRGSGLGMFFLWQFPSGLSHFFTSELSDDIFWPEKKSVIKISNYLFSIRYV